MSETVEAYKVGVAFVANAERVTGPIGDMLKSMDRILQAQKSVNMGFTEMVSALGGARRLAGGLANDMERAARAARDMATASSRFRGMGGGFGGGGGGSGSSASSGDSAPRPQLLLGAPSSQSWAEPDSSLPDEPFNEREGLRSRIGRYARGTAAIAAAGVNGVQNFRLPTHHHALTLPEVFAGYMGWHVLSSGFEQAGVYDQTFAGLAGDPRANIPQLRALAATIRRGNPYVNAPDSATLVSEAYDLSGGNMREVPGIANVLSRTDQAFQLMGRSGADALRESANFVRAQDVSNRFFNRQTGEFDINRANDSTEAALGMVFANRQFMNGRNFFQFARSAGSASQQMSDEGMFNLAHFIDINPARAGMQVRSLENLFGGNHTRMTDRDFAYFRSLPGLVGRNGQFNGQDQLRSDPIGWITQHLVPLMRTHPELVGAIQRMNVGDLVNETQGAQGNIARQAAADRRTNATNAIAALGSGSRAAQQRTEVAWERFEFTLGQFGQGPGIQILNGLTDSLNRLSAYMTTHPDDMNRLGSQITGAAQALLGASKIVGQIGTAIPSWLWPVLLGAAGGGRVAGPWGAAAGAAGGAVYDAVHGARSLDHRYGYDQPGYVPTWRDKLDPFQLFHTPQAPDVHTHVYLDSREIAHHVDRQAARTSQQSRRAQSSGADGLSTTQVPGAAWSH